jgi:hypothetical protein
MLVLRCAQVRDCKSIAKEVKDHSKVIGNGTEAIAMVT